MKVLDIVAAADNGKAKERGSWRGKEEVLRKGQELVCEAVGETISPIFSPNTTGREMRPWTSLHVPP